MKKNDRPAQKGKKKIYFHCLLTNVNCQELVYFRFEVSRNQIQVLVENLFCSPSCYLLIGSVKGHFSHDERKKEEENPNRFYCTTVAIREH